MRNLTGLLFVTLVMLCLASCPTQDSGPRSLVIAVPGWIGRGSDLAGAVARFTEAHPLVKVSILTVDGPDIPALIDQWEQGETPFDLFLGGTADALAPAVGRNLLEPLDDLLSGDLARDKFLSGFIRDVYFKRPDGRGGFFPMLPFMGEAIMFGVNTDFCKRAGFWKESLPIGPVITEERDFVNYFRKLGASADAGAHLQIWEKDFLQYNYTGPILAMEGAFVEKNGKGFDVSSDSAKKWLGILQRMKTRGVLVPADSQAKALEIWKTGRCASFYAIQDRIMELASQAGKPLTVVGFLNFPGSELHGSIIRTQAVWIPEVAENKDIARQFIREEVLSRTFQQWQFNKQGRLPVLREAFGEGLKKYREYLPLFLSVADNSKSIPLWNDHDRYLAVFNASIRDAIDGKLTVEEALEKIKTESADLDFTDMREVLK